MQANQYKDGKEITKTTRELLQEGKLTPLQAGLFEAPRPVEELYDLQKDPLEIDNLADDPEFAGILQEMRAYHRQWMKESKDMGLIPEPILEEMGKTYGNKYHVLHAPEHAELIDDIIAVIELGEKGAGAVSELQAKLKDDRAAIRYRAAYALGNLGRAAIAAASQLRASTGDPDAAVRIVAARALCLTGQQKAGLEVLHREFTTSGNHLVRHHAALFFEDVGPMARPYLDDFRKAASEDSYEFVRRVARRLVADLASS
jgi:uncharacterized sulfatase